MTGSPGSSDTTFDTRAVLARHPSPVAPQVREWFGELLFVTCCHEAGHAVIAHQMGSTNINIRICATLDTATNGRRRAASVNGLTQSRHDLDDHFGAVVVTFAGALAEPGAGTRPGSYPATPSGGRPTGTDLDKINAYRRRHGHTETRRAEQTARALIRQEHQAIHHVATRLFGRGPWVGQRHLDVSDILG